MGNMSIMVKEAISFEVVNPEIKGKEIQSSITAQEVFRNNVKEQKSNSAVENLNTRNTGLENDNGIRR